MRLGAKGMVAGSMTKIMWALNSPAGMGMFLPELPIGMVPCVNLKTVRMMVHGLR